MRHSATHLAFVLCTSLAVSSAPVSPLPVSPALMTSMQADDNEIRDSNTNDQKGSMSLEKNVGGFVYHSVNQNELDRRATGDLSNVDGAVESFSPSDSEDGYSSAHESDSGNDVAAASDTEIQKRSIPEIWTRSPPPSPLEAKNDVSGSDNNASIASADDYTSVMSDDDETSSAALADSFSADDEAAFASEFDEEDAQDPSNKQQVGAAEVADGENNKAKVGARSIDNGSQSERHGGRNYMNANSWKA